MMNIGVKRIDGSDNSIALPRKASSGASGWDIRANFSAPDRRLDGMEIRKGAVVAVPTGFALEIPRGFEGQIRSRSGLALNKSLFVLNSPGTVDCDFRGEVFVLLANLGPRDERIKHGDRIAQLVFCKVPEVVLKERDVVSSTSRGNAGLGSTGIE